MVTYRGHASLAEQFILACFAFLLNFSFFIIALSVRLFLSLSQILFLIISSSANASREIKHFLLSGQLDMERKCDDETLLKFLSFEAQNSVDRRQQRISGLTVQSVGISFIASDIENFVPLWDLKNKIAQPRGILDGKLK